ncbi:hexosaminidase subunit alpha [Seminavis robusta]|uniref:beta-N-acetylhexosaminidase n=1 Tax=Seminavis robusta TaxID=568900 RepID=A0A9N8H489_9STRA|nr:hexosaminidase subunit alpha [Seminavis robusta]|eukprot:Sro56_g032830.1 hexosaminidase subunit alpha (1049) ;mRNA; f:78151-81297
MTRSIGSRRRLPLVLSATLIAVASRLLVGSSSGLFVQAYQPTEEDEETRGANKKDIHHAEFRRRLVHKTLDPKSRANILAAHELAMAQAKAEGKFLYEERDDPFQVMSGETMKRQDAQAKKDGSTSPPKDAHIIEQLQSRTVTRGMDPLIQTEKDDENVEALDKKLPWLSNKESVHLAVDYLGVTVDAGRHYFPMSWWKRLIVYLHKMHYNLIHLRLADEENFAVRLDSYPQLAAAAISNKTYSPAELKELVAFAKQHHITIIPELQMPVRTTSWAGAVPGLIMPCANFICETSHYVPLNLDHPDLPAILEGVLKEVIAIFGNPSMLHLGGALFMDEAKECLREVAKQKKKEVPVEEDPATIYWIKWEGLIREVLKRLGYPEKKVIRTQHVASVDDEKEESVSSTKATEDTNKAKEESKPIQRVGGIEHYWMTFPQDGNSNNINSKNWVPLPESIVSTGLDFALDDDDSAWKIYKHTQQVLELSVKPKAILVGTMHLSTNLLPQQNLWLQRNVLARLVAVSMAATEEANKKELSEFNFELSYQRECLSLLPKALCELKGHTLVSRRSFLGLLSKRSQDWRQAICRRLTLETSEISFQPAVHARASAIAGGNDVFGKFFHRLPEFYQPNNERGCKKVLVDPVKALKQKVEKTGVILDMANSLAYPRLVKTLFVDFIAPLGMDWLQLRLSDDFAFVPQLEYNSLLAQSMWTDELPGLTEAPKIKFFHRLVNAANEWGVDIIPEISISTNAGGWINGGFLVQCPKLFCKDGTGIPNNIQDPLFLPLVYDVIRELRVTFGGSYFHLGTDERVDNLKCFEENGLKDDEDPPFGEFERNLQKLLAMLGIEPESVIRYDNEEQLTYKDRVGKITHYRAVPGGDMPDIREEEPFVVTVDLLESNIYSIYKRTRKLVGLKPMGIMGEIRSLDQEVWKQQYMGLRLIAFKMGFSEWEGEQSGDEELDHKEFIKEVLRICTALNYSECKEEGGGAEKLLKSEKIKEGDDDDAVDSAPETYPIATQKFRNALCTKHTRFRKSKRMKDEFVLQADQVVKTG